MATIKDVASLAGVSHGTVSNVLRGTGKVSLDKIQKVMGAVETLGYQPDNLARSMKSSQINSVGIILPDITNHLYAQIFTFLENYLGERGYAAVLYTTDEIIEKEKRHIASALGMKIPGLILITCQPDNFSFFQAILSNGAKIVFIEREIQGLSCSFAGFQNDESVYRAAKDLLGQGYRRIALITGPDNYSSEELCKKGYIRAMEEGGIRADPDVYFRSTNNSNESAFKAAMQLTGLSEPPDSVICASTPILEGALGVRRWAGISPLFVCLGETGWNNNRFSDVWILPRSGRKLGETAARLLLDNLENPAFHERKRVFPEQPDFTGFTPAAVKTHDSTIRVVMLEGDMSEAFRALLPNLKKNLGIQAEIHTCFYDELYDYAKKQCSDSSCDALSIDMQWIPEFVGSGFLTELTPFISNSGFDMNSILEETLDDFAVYNGKIYGIPAMYCNQLLFYRKDLFGDMRLKRMFFERYGSELIPPRTWTEFNAIAKFFTKKYNPGSPALYGTTLGGRYSSAAVCEFLPRLWAFGGDVFNKNGQVILDDPEAVKALENYRESFLYASPASPENWWDEQVSEFAAGQTAMMTLYSAHASKIVDRSVSRIVGHIGFCPIPGGCPVLGGYSLAVNQKSREKEAAFEFIKWACGADCAIPSTIMGSFSACKTLYDSIQFQSAFPWMRMSLDVLPGSGRRLYPVNKQYLSIKDYERIIGRAVHDTIVNKTEPGEALAIAAERLRGVTRRER